jgi:uncharacterized metal-binding protein YceD (DUF177 family)
MMTPEFSNPVPLSEIGGKPVHYKLAADDAQRAGLAKRFDLLSLDSLTANVELWQDGDAIAAKGDVSAKLEQACIASGAAVPDVIAESFNIRFLAETAHAPDAEIELGEDDCDTMFHDGRIVDLGEAIAQTLGLAINPYPRSPDADAALKKAGVKGEDEAGPFAALAALRKGAD